ncbi:MAG: DNA repair protein RecN [Candidatus Zixiibacteriota bacterium]
MLKRLYIENFALVEKLELEFDRGMSVLTGETGAGKSIIIGALARLLGEKADKNDIRSGTNLAVVEADFDISQNKTVQKILHEFEIENDNAQISLRREMPVNKASRSFINGQLVNLNQIKSITDEIAELFGQHSHQLLLDEKNHLSFLDSFTGLTGTVEKLTAVYSDWQSVLSDLNRTMKNKETAQNERELLLFQKKEIESANIRVGEEEELITEKKILDSSQLLGEKCNLILEMIDRDENSALNILNTAGKEMNSIVKYDNSLTEKANLLESAIINLDELRAELESYLASIPDDPNRLDEINMRLDEIYRLKKKYGGSEESIITALEQIDFQLASKIDVDEKIKMLSLREVEFRTEYTKCSLDISAKRKAASEKLSQTVEKELKTLGIDSAKFEFEFIYEDDNGGIKLGERRVKGYPWGLENGRFLISANPGEPLKPLSRTASGGEISRIMLALKSAENVGKYNGVRLLVFDEIDAGIGGETANMVARRLARIAKTYQLLVISHLHQLASVGDNHYAVEKIKKNNRNIVAVKRLDDNDREKEIARMLALPIEE